MLMQNDKAFAAADPITPFDFAREPAFSGAGLLANTSVESDQGWITAGQLHEGCLVQTYDGGLRAITRLERRPLSPLAQLGLIHIPGGSLCNCSDLWLLPDQAVLIRDPLIEEVFDCAGALVPARDLQGHRGIARRPLDRPTDLIRLGFAQDELLYANSGMLLHAPATTGRRDGFFPRLNSHQARAMLALIAAGGPSFGWAA